LNRSASGEDRINRDLNAGGLAVFTAGYRWSGSGAVSDWLGGHEDICRVEGSEAAFGEIRAVNYGLRFLVQTAAGRTRYGELLGRWAICPDPAYWPRILGKPLSRNRGRLGILYLLADRLYFSAARFFVIPGVKKYKSMLDAQLGGDFRQDEEYLALVKDLASSLRLFMKNRRIAGAPALPEEDEAVRLAASRFLALFVRRLGTRGKVLLFDNAISGLNPELFHLLHPSLFPGQIIILVRRDPRDQFTDLVKYSGSTFPWTVGHFIRQYRNVQEKTRRFLEALDLSEGETGCRRFVRQVSFEAFVLDKRGTRTGLKDDLQEFWEPLGLKKIDRWQEASPDDILSDGKNGLFNPEASGKNIGIWRTSGMVRQMQRIARELPNYIDPEI